MQPIVNILFIPVSSTSGIGEYTRSLIIANELKKQFPALKISFLLNKHAACSKTCPFDTHLTNGSATKDNKTVHKVMKKLKPQLVVFDCSGRVSQFKLAKQLGAKVIFISQHEKKRRRGLGFRRLLNTDIHWVAQSSVSIKPISILQKIKLKLLDKPIPKVIGPVFTNANSDEIESFLTHLNLRRKEFLLFNAGSGGHVIDSVLASDLFFEVASEISSSLNIKALVIFGPNYPNPLPSDEVLSNLPNVICTRGLENMQFIGLLSSSQGAVLAGGDTFLQALELDVDCVVTAVSKDQPRRIASCDFLPRVTSSEANKVNLCRATKKMLQNSPTNQSKAETKKIALDVVISDVKNLLQIS